MWQYDEYHNRQLQYGTILPDQYLTAIYEKGADISLHSVLQMRYISSYCTHAEPKQ